MRNWDLVVEHNVAPLFWHVSCLHSWPRVPCLAIDSVPNRDVELYTVYPWAPSGQWPLGDGLYDCDDFISVSIQDRYLRLHAQNQCICVSSMAALRSQMKLYPDSYDPGPGGMSPPWHHSVGGPGPDIRCGGHWPPAKWGWVILL